MCFKNLIIQGITRYNIAQALSVPVLVSISGMLEKKLIDKKYIENLKLHLLSFSVGNLVRVNIKLSFFVESQFILFGFFDNLVSHFLLPLLFLLEPNGILPASAKPKEMMYILATSNCCLVSIFSKKINLLGTRRVKKNLTVGIPSPWFLSLKDQFYNSNIGAVIYKTRSCRKYFNYVKIYLVEKSLLNKAKNWNDILRAS